MEADFKSREHPYRTDLNRFRWVHDRMNECWFALRCMHVLEYVGSGGESQYSLKGY